MFPRVILQDVKNKVYEATQEVFEDYGIVETEKVRALLEEDYGICFFNTIELEKLIKEGLDKQIFACKDKGNAQEKQGFIIQCKSCDHKEEIEQAIEVARAEMEASIANNKNLTLYETVRLSQKLDILIVASMRNSL